MGQKTNRIVWVAEDGKEFEDEESMRAYESAETFGDLVDSYLDSSGVGDGMSERAAKAARTRARSTILAVMSWLDQHGMLCESEEQSEAA